MNEIKKEKVKTATVPLVPEDSALMTNEKFYPKPLVILENAETSIQTKQNFEKLLENMIILYPSTVQILGKPL